MALIYHYTNLAGFNGIRAAKVWRFVASQPTADHRLGAYFTDYDESTPLLALKLRIPRGKTGYVFIFHDAGDLTPINGNRGKHIFYSPTDYFVEEPRQVGKRKREGS